MRIQACALACLLAGCATQPSRATAPTPVAIQAPDVDPGALRISLEFLPPDDRFATSEPLRVEARTTNRSDVPAERRAVHAVALPDDAKTSIPEQARIDLDAVDDPIAREALHFCSDLIAADRRRVRREAGIPFFELRTNDQDRGLLLTSERRLLEDQERWSQQLGTALLKRPLRLLARRLPLARELDLALRDFRADFVPLSEPYREVHGDRRELGRAPQARGDRLEPHQQVGELGRLSVRLSVRDLQDPVEVVYFHPSGVRLGSSQERAKLALNYPLTERLRLDLRARTDFDSGDTGLRADVVYRHSPSMSVYVTAGDALDIRSATSLYSLLETPSADSPGLMLYAVHTF